MNNPKFDLKELTRLMVCRNNDPQGFNCENKEPTFFIAGMVEELGEISGALKKLERGFNNRERGKFVKKLQVKWEEEHPGQSEYFSQASNAELETMWLKSKLVDFMKEGADLFLYFNLLSTIVQRQYGLQVDFFDTVLKKFNEVSRELNPNSTYIIANTEL